MMTFFCFRSSMVLFDISSVKSGCILCALIYSFNVEGHLIPFVLIPWPANGL